ncbi:DUF4231 domain-containing protein [Pectobacterium polaris]|uniref:DUF4231 domain-containing protein n=1 Tax=Pectobacterium polaris TaxID=2042057 RepID=UPI00158283D9|nr:DUF4231 domain-containing protein [Pectobacterium polaris]
MSEDGKSLAERYALEQLNHYKKKADHNKSESIWCFKGAMVCSLLCPLFMSLGEGIWLSKIIPSLLSAFAAFSTAWLQLRKPHALWAVYRTAQRKIETTLTHYQFRVEKFDSMSDSIEQADKLLISEVTNFASEAHNTWAKNVPDASSLNKITLTGKE